MEPDIVYIGLGSNLGDRVMALDTANEKLKKLAGSNYIALSGLYETSAVGLEGGPFINAVAVIRSELGPRTLLRALLDMETAMGRAREPGGSGSRLIDLDILLYGDATIEEPNLVIPHPRMLLRRFVMDPLAELAPELNIPPDGINASEAAAQLAKSCPDQKIRRLGTLQELKESSIQDPSTCAQS